MEQFIKFNINPLVSSIGKAPGSFTKDGVPLETSPEYTLKVVSRKTDDLPIYPAYVILPTRVFVVRA